MKWYRKEFLNLVMPMGKEITEYLDKLSANNVKVENIKIVSASPTWYNVYYYHNREI